MAVPFRTREAFAIVLDTRTPCSHFAALGAILVCAIALLVRPAHAQHSASSHRPAFRAIAFNAAAGGTIALLRSLLNNQSKPRALLGGAGGGALHGMGKAVMTSERSSLNYAGAFLSATGISIVSNSARPQGLFSELYLPVGPLRLRLANDSSGRRLRMALNLVDAARIAIAITDDSMQFESRETLRRGVVVFTSTAVMPKGDGVVYGFQSGPLIGISSFVLGRSQVWRHEIIHYGQWQFVQETVGLPIESCLRRAVGEPEWWPHWIELGATPGALLKLDNVVGAGDPGPFRRLIESEAEWFTKRTRPRE